MQPTARLSYGEINNGSNKDICPIKIFITKS